MNYHPDYTCRICSILLSKSVKTFILYLGFVPTWFLKRSDQESKYHFQGTFMLYGNNLRKGYRVCKKKFFIDKETGGAVVNQSVTTYMFRAQACIDMICFWWKSKLSSQGVIIGQERKCLICSFFNLNYWVYTVVLRSFHVKCVQNIQLNNSSCDHVQFMIKVWQINTLNSFCCFNVEESTWDIWSIWESQYDLTGMHLESLNGFTSCPKMCQFWQAVTFVSC